MSGEDDDWKEQYDRNPIARAVTDSILSQHPEIGGNPWLARDIAKGFTEGTRAMSEQMQSMMNLLSQSTGTIPSFIHDSIQVDMDAAQFKAFQTEFKIPKPEPVTPDRLLAALAANPELLLAVKALMLEVRVAGPWVLFNDSEWAKLNKIGFPKGTLCRFVPDQRNKAKMEPVIKVHKRTKPWMPNRHQMDEDWEWAEQVKDHEAEVAEWEVKPFGWRVESQFHRLFPMKGREGNAVDIPTAQRDADAVLRSVGWVLVDP
ncbi:hypothetical protein N9917_00260 [Deltaproteobacteria bacterium]|nr:hypothetical protein [Deltaproteobacteria bacterium]